MRLYPECIVCQVQVRYRDIVKLFHDTKQQIETLRLMLELISDELRRGVSNPVRIATRLFRTLKSLSRVEDPYASEKAETNRLALELYSSIRSLVLSTTEARERLELALRFSIVGNALDLGVSGYVPPSIADVIDKARTIHIHGDLDSVIELLLHAKSVAVLMDNCGEAVFDRVLGDVLRSLGKRAVAIVKGGPFQNDVTIREAAEIGLHESFDNVVDTGTDAASVFLDEASPTTLRTLKNVDVIVSKGMANYEYLTEVESTLKKPIVYLLIAKCEPIALDTGAPRGAALAIVHSPHKL